ncbi:MAG: DUF2313 domain-containing protein [Enhydrobacter sp.]|nr:DUF2313 domain-containing protein [Enhydrobacter sp.]
MRAPVPTLEEWRAATADLLPPGRAWSRDPNSNLGRLISVLARERRSRHKRAVTLLEVEAFPTTALELLPEWEQAAGLPDPCRPLPGTLADRWAALADVFFADHPPTPDNMVLWAVQAGWTVTIREQRDFVAGVSMAGDAVGESDFVWVVTIEDQVISYFRAGQGASGDPLYSFPDIATLECVLRRAAPAHTQVHFIVPV